MCGIVGGASRSGTLDLPVVAMRDAMAHRGPDDAGAWRSPDGRVWLAHRRLSIVDLSPAGRGPMADGREQVWLTFNGEVYNHHALRSELRDRGHAFRTGTDTEVVLEAYREWGTGCLDRLDGMFAFGLYDTRTRSLFLARDRAGEKPLFWFQDGERFLFASELKALMADPSFPRRLDRRALDHYLALGYVPHDLCILEGVRKLPQGCALTYDVGAHGVSTWRYWDLPEDAQQPPASEQDLVAELEWRLQESVRLRLLADVPVGILLSGGVDSSLVTALAATSSSAPVRTFTISFPGHGAYDEGPYAKVVAGHFGTEHTELVAEDTTVDLLPTLARQYDEPIADSSMVPTYLVSKLVRQHCTVALGGDGGDELFGGYGHYRRLLVQERLRRFVPRPARRAAARLGEELPVGLKGRNYLLGFGADLTTSVAHSNLYFDRAARRRLLGPAAMAADHEASPEAFREELCPRRGTAVERATALDFRMNLVDDILVKVDRASMLSSLEVRAPWLDHHIVELAFRCPSRLRATTQELKVLPRRLARRLLPPELDIDRKQGFSIPLHAWFKGSWGAFVRDVLRDAEPALFDQAVIQGLLASQRRGSSNTRHLFALAFFELWRREYRVELPSSSAC